MSRPPQDRLLALGRLLRELQLHGFVVDVERQIRLERLLARVGVPDTDDDLKTLLCPIFATDPGEQETFHRLFAQSFSGETAGGPAPPAPEEAAAGPVSRRPRGRRTLVAVALLSLLGLGLVLLFVLPHRPHPVLPTSTLGNPAGSSPTASLEAQRHENERSPAWALFALALLPWTLLLLYLLRRRLIRWRAERRRPPFSLPIRASEPKVQEHRSDLFYDAARALRRRRISDVERLDVARSIAASIATGGFPSLRYRPDSEVPEYLVLIQRASFRDHLATLFARLAQALQDEGLYLAWYFYEADPRVCSGSEAASPVRLVDLQKSHPAHRLLLFTEGDELCDPISGRLADWTSLLLEWRERALLTPREEGSWGLREQTLGERFVVLPATVAGLCALPDRLEVSQAPEPAPPARSEPPPPDLPRGSRPVDAARLKGWLGEPVFRWLCACAAYPGLHWPMTLRLATLPSLGDGRVREEPLLKLARLPWFSRGSLPEGLRLELLAELRRDPSREREVREAVLDLLRDSSAREGSFAAADREMQILAQTAELHRGEPGTFRRTLRRLRRFPPGELAADPSLQKLLEEAPLASRALRLPAGLRRLLFRRGHPLFGFRLSTGLLGSGAITLALLLPLYMGRTEPPRPSDAAGATAAEPLPLATESPMGTDFTPMGTDFAQPIGTDSMQPMGTDPVPPKTNANGKSRAKRPAERTKSPDPQPTPTEPSKTSGATGTEAQLTTENLISTEPGEVPGKDQRTPFQVPTAVPPAAQQQKQPEAGRAASLESSLLSTLAGFTKKGNLYLKGQIPPGKLKNARSAASLPRTEEVLALVDITIFGSARNSILFSGTGIYIRDIFSDPVFISYPELAAMKLRVKSVFLQRVGGSKVTFPFAGTGFSAQEGLEMLEAVQRAVGAAGAGPGPARP